MRSRHCWCFSNLLIHTQATLSRKEKLPACDTPVPVLARRSHRLPRAPTAALWSRLLPPRASLARSLRSRAAGATREHGWSSSTCRPCWSSGSTTPFAVVRTSWPRYCCGSQAVLCGSWPSLPAPPASPLSAWLSVPLSSGTAVSRLFNSVSSVSSLPTFTLILG